MIPLSKYSELPEMFVSVWAISPPVHDSAVATVSLCFFSKLKTLLRRFSSIKDIASFMTWVFHYLKDLHFLMLKVIYGNSYASNKVYWPCSVAVSIRDSGSLDSGSNPDGAVFKLLNSIYGLR